MRKQDVEQIASEIFRNPKLVSVDDFELVIQDEESHDVKFRNGESVQREFNSEIWISLRVERRRQVGRASVSEFSPEKLSQLVDQAVRVAEASDANPWFKFPRWKTTLSVTEHPVPLPPAPGSFRGNLVPDFLFFEEKHRAFTQSTAIWRKSEKNSLYYSKGGTELEFFLGNERAINQSPFWISEFVSGRGAFSDVADTLEKMVARSLSFQQAQPFQGGDIGAIGFSPSVSAILLREMLPFFSSSYRAEALEKDKGQFSFLASEKIRIVDDATLPERLQSYPFDLEGVQGQRTVLFEKGMEKDLLSDNFWAAKRNRLSTGNYTRGGHDEVPTIRPSNLFIEPNPGQSLLQLLSLIPKGIYLDTVDSMDAVRHRRRMRASGWKIKEGKLHSPVFGIPLDIELTDFLKGASSVGADLSFLGSCGAPSLFFEKIPLSI